MALSKKYGPIMSLRLGSVQAIIVSSPQAAELFLKTHDVIFASRPRIQASECLSYGSKGIAFSQYGPYWRNMRKFCTSELLNTAKIDSLVEMRREEVGLFMEAVKEAAVAREVVDVSEKVTGLIENMTNRMVFGRSKDERFDLKTAVREAMFTVGAFNLADYLPFIAPLDLQGLTRRLTKVHNTLDKILETIIDEHKQNIGLGHQRHGKDFIDEMLLLEKKSTATNDELSYTIDRSNTKAIVLDMLVGAIDTSATIIEWVLSELIRHPRIMKKLQEELNTIVGVDRMVEEVDLSKLTYLDMVVRESLRLHPVAPLLVPRESSEDIVINGYFIPKKSRVMVNYWAFGHDPQVWSNNCEEFLPERFIGSNIDLRGRDFQLIPFGSGRRGCPGLHLGLINTQLVVAQLAHCFNWELPDGMAPSDLDMSEKFGLSLPRANHLLAIPTYRL